MADEPGFKYDEEGAWIEKDPNANKDYKLDFSKWLIDGDTLVAAVFTVPIGLVKTAEGLDATNAFVKVSGGVVGNNYTITVHVTTAQGREDDKSFRVVIREA